MAEKVKELFKHVKGVTSRGVFFVALAVILFALVAWFVIANFVSLIGSLNKAFGTQFEIPPPSISFDRQSFDELNLIKER